MTAGRAGRPRCEHLDEALGITETRPSLSWRPDAPGPWRLSAGSAPGAEDLWAPEPFAAPWAVWDGPPLRARDRVWWRVDGGEEASFEVGLLDADWTAPWVTLPRPEAVRDGYRPSPVLRAAFDGAEAAGVARLYVTALGTYRAFVNGARVGRDELTPGWTDYRTRAAYQTYDVTPLLASGGNELRVVLADGWYAGYLGTDRVRARYGGEPVLRAQLELGGAAVPLAWEGAFGEVLAADHYLGEVHDARLAPREWRPATVVPAPAIRLTGRAAPPVRDEAPVAAVTTHEHRAGHLLVDFGRTVAGRVRVRVEGRRGDEVTVRHAEMLAAGGRTLYPDNLRHALSTDTYVLRGEGIEEWQPAFTYHGFRYAEVVAAPGATLHDVVAVPLRSQAARTGSFACSDERIDALHEAVARTVACNWVDVPTDCPQRDERLGWTGDAYVNAVSATYLYDSRAFLGKWLDDVLDARTADGLYTDVAPAVPPWDVAAAPGWGDGGVVTPWVLHAFYDDPRLLARHLPAMRRWVDAALERHPSHVWETGRGNDYGDWLAFDETPKDLFATAILAESVATVAAACGAVGDVAGAHEYARRHAAVRAAFASRFPDLPTQTANVLALRFRLLDAGRAASTARRLAEDVRGRGGLSTGFFGTEHLLGTLARHGEPDLAYDVLTRDELPSWLFMLRHGATTLWEHWDSWTPGAGFKDPFMNSFCHNSLGSVVRFLYETVAGIRPDPTAPGFARVLVEPVPGRALDWAEASYESVRGRVATRWERSDGGIVLTVDVPPASEARVVLPGRPPVVVGPGRHVLR